MLTMLILRRPHFSSIRSGPHFSSLRHFSTKIRSIDKILVANRGEIACRVIRTARKLGIKSVAVYSDADVGSMHVSMADEAYRIGPPSASESYLKGDVIISVAKKSGAVAIHPGYGFLSENEKFARACEANQIIFVGPPASAIQAMGSKSASKQIMIQANVPVVPGYHGEEQDFKILAQEAAKIGYPVMLKAVLGGGGKGMRIVQNPEELPYALEACKRESMSSFGDDRVLIEKYITKPRHVEFQVFADNFDNVVYLFERDCSVQRRHQKVIEEAPAPGMKPELRAQMGEAAANCARAVGYRGAGTVEFIFDVEADTFYFMEMNTRLQVEHPVTEMITNQDLVEWQIRVAEGNPLPKKQEELEIHGHAFESRIYAENPDKEFLPGTGTLEYLQPPTTIGDERHVRIDTGVRQGDEVSVFYDPMISKLIVWDKNRHLALCRLKAALENYHIVGLNTNIPFLLRLASHPEFQAGNVDTGFIPRYREDLIKSTLPPVPLLAVALAQMAKVKEESHLNPKSAGDPHSPWGFADGFRVNHEYSTTNEFTSHDGEKQYKTTITYKHKKKNIISYDILVSSGNTSQEFKNITGNYSHGRLSLSLDGEQIKAVVVQTQDGTINVHYDGKEYQLGTLLPSFSIKAEEKGGLHAPMPGKVVKIFITEGAEVKTGEPLLILEAMKMEHKICSPKGGKVKSIHFKVGDLVNMKATLVTIE